MSTATPQAMPSSTGSPNPSPRLGIRHHQRPAEERRELIERQIARPDQPQVRWHLGYRGVDVGVPALASGEHEDGRVDSIAAGGDPCAHQGGNVLAWFERAQEGEVLLGRGHAEAWRAPSLLPRRSVGAKTVVSTPRWATCSLAASAPATRTSSSAVDCESTTQAAARLQREPGGKTEERRLRASVQARIGEERRIVQRHHGRHGREHRQRVVRAVQHVGLRFGGGTGQPDLFPAESDGPALDRRRVPGSARSRSALRNGRRHGAGRWPAPRPRSRPGRAAGCLRSDPRRRDLQAPQSRP